MIGRVMYVSSFKPQILMVVTAWHGTDILWLFNTVSLMVVLVGFAPICFVKCSLISVLLLPRSRNACVAISDHCMLVHLLRNDQHHDEPVVRPRVPLWELHFVFTYRLWRMSCIYMLLALHLPFIGFILCLYIVLSCFMLHCIFVYHHHCSPVYFHNRHFII